MVSTKEMRKRLRKRRFFEYIAYWQLMAFVMLLLFIWGNELLDFTAIVFNTAPAEPSIYRGCLLSFAAVVCAIVVIGNSYVQEKRIIKGMITVCSYCSRVKVDRDDWEEMQTYMLEHSMAVFSHGICPGCIEKIESSAQTPDPASPTPSDSSIPSRS